MSFLDNLENNLKSAEALEERTAVSSGRNQESKEAERVAARAARPFAEQLRKGPFTAGLLNEATRIAHGLRTKVYIAWIDSTLRLDARDHRLELRPTASGVLATFFVDRQETAVESVDLNGDPKALAERWLSRLELPPATPSAG
jgi:hypothetical protein